jgi:acetylornithine deacetylase/succinyl-diaminopimelate desuccinylase-like protein
MMRDAKARAYSRRPEAAPERFISVATTMLFLAQRRDQFQPRVESTNLFGRGSSDMKSGLAAMIYAAGAARDEGLLKTGRIGIVLVPDEETAGPRGSRHVDACGLLGKDAVGMLTPEPTGGVIWNANRGAISLRATMRGKAAHVGRQFEGVDAFERAAPAVARLLTSRKTESFAKRNTTSLQRRRENPF